jgi:hypothetical protein
MSSLKQKALHFLGSCAVAAVLTVLALAYFDILVP